MKNFCLIVGALLQFVIASPAMAFVASDQVEMTIEIMRQTAHGYVQGHCQDSVHISGYLKKNSWVVMAEPSLASGNSSQEAGNRLTCGNGRIEEAIQHSQLSAEFAIIARPVRKMEDEWNLAVELLVSLHRRLDKGEQGAPSYETTEIKRVLYFSDDAETIIPLLIVNGQDRQQPGNDELFLRISADATAAHEASTFGTILVTSELEEGKLYLDGGLAGKITAGQETILRNVNAGVRLLEARDATGREIRSSVRVLADRMVLADLNNPDPQRTAGAHTLESLGSNAQGFEEYWREIDQAVAVRIPAGEFLMGNRDTERTPLEHTVYVSDFLIDKTGVSWRQYMKFAAATGTPLPPAEPYWGFPDDHPAVYVTWVEAKSYCEWAGGRLPTEAEREKAARGTDGRKYPWGDNEPAPDLGVFRKSWGHHSTAPVGTHPAGASPYGVLDMGGNVWEWCSDWYDDDYYAVSPYRNPQGPATGKAHVVRGGSWDSRPTVLSASCRSWGHRGYRDGDFGFRCAMNAP